MGTSLYIFGVRTLQWGMEKIWKQFSDAVVKQPRKMGALAVLIAQTVSLVMAIRVSRTQVGAKYLPSTAVFLSEILKLLMAASVLHFQAGGSVGETWNIIQLYVFERYQSTLLLGVPSLLYVLQNNVLYIAISSLEPATYQITYQLKILTTVGFTILLFGRKVSNRQWLALTLLMIGIIIVQLDIMPSSSKSAASVSASPPALRDPSSNDLAFLDALASRFSLSFTSLKGLAAVLMACLTSGFAGVYFEGILKNTSATSTTSVPVAFSVWIRNIQFALFGIVLSFAAVYIKDGLAVAEYGFFQNYNSLTILIIFMQAWGGILVAVVVKYCDSITKGFASALSIVFSGLTSILFFGFSPSLMFVLGSLLVVSATVLYAYNPDQASGTPPPPLSDSSSCDSSAADDLESRSHVL